MAGSVNKVILVGNLGQDPEVRTTQDGQKIVNSNLATSENWNDKASGERKERTEWHRVVIFNERSPMSRSGSSARARKVYVEGALQTRKWTDKSGQEKYTTEVVLGRFRGELTLLDSAARRGRRRERRWCRLPRARARRRGRPRRPRGWTRRRHAVLGRAEGRRPGRRDSVLTLPPAAGALGIDRTLV